MPPLHVLGRGHLDDTRTSSRQVFCCDLADSRGRASDDHDLIFHVLVNRREGVIYRHRWSISRRTSEYHLNGA